MLAGEFRESTSSECKTLLLTGNENTEIAAISNIPMNMMKK